MIAQQTDLLAAIEARDRGMAQATLGADVLWSESVRVAIERLAGEGRPFTADDIRDLTGDPPPSFSPNAMGALVSAAAKSGVIRQVGYAKSARVIGHGNLQRQWVGEK